jgi:hypothetical protein
MIMSLEEKDALTKKAYMEVVQMVKDEIRSQREYFEKMFMSKDECEKSHIGKNKEQSEENRKITNKFWQAFVLAGLSLCISCIALGMRITEVIQNAIGAVA